MINKIKIAVDAMGGEDSPHKIIEGIKISLKHDPDLFFNIYGDENLLINLINKTNIEKNNYSLINCTVTIKDDESPLQAAKKAKESSMGKSINSLNEDNSDIVLSAGNTGALLLLSKMSLNMIKGIDKPALAGLWPNKIGMNIVLDLGANIECSEKNLLDFTLMGSALHKALYPNEESKVAILNVGSEEIKGHDTVKSTYQTLKKINNKNFEFKGYVEGNHIMNGDVNVIVTDGFTGNVALKTAEGTANFVTTILKDSLNSNIYSKLLTMLNYTNLKKFKNKLDPRKYNGAIFIGLDKPVVKSHGSTDSFGFANSIIMCKKIVTGNLIRKINSNLDII